MDYIDNEDGVLIIPMNYTGDVLNFGMATEKARAAGIQTEFFAINDDAGVGKKKGGKVGRRGIAGGILILKMVGALAEEGYVPCFTSKLYAPSLTPRLVARLSRSLTWPDWPTRTWLLSVLLLSTFTSPAVPFPRTRCLMTKSKLAWVSTTNPVLTEPRLPCPS